MTLFYLHLEALDNMTPNRPLMYSTACLVFARERQTCRSGLQTDGSSITLNTCDRWESLRSFCHGEHFHFGSILQHDWSSESVMFWGGLVRGDLSAVRFQDEGLKPDYILGQAVPASICCMIMHCWMCQQFLVDEDVNVTDWPKRFQDLSLAVGHYLLLHSPPACRTRLCLSHRVRLRLWYLDFLFYSEKWLPLVSDDLLFFSSSVQTLISSACDYVSSLNLNMIHQITRLQVLLPTFYSQGLTPHTHWRF